MIKYDDDNFKEEVNTLVKKGIAVWILGLVLVFLFYLGLFAGAAWLIKTLFF